MTKMPNKDQIAQLLLAPDALLSLSLEDAKTIVGYMLLTNYKPESVIFQANVASDYMLLVLRGDVQIEACSTGDGTVIVDIASQGHLLGEMGVLDGSARSATCTAKTDVEVAMLSKSDLARLLTDSPSIAARFILAIAMRLADRLRLANRKLLMMNQVNTAMQEEIQTQRVRRPHRFLV